MIKQLRDLQMMTRPVGLCFASSAASFIGPTFCSSVYLEYKSVSVVDSEAPLLILITKTSGY